MVTMKKFLKQQTDDGTLKWVEGPTGIFTAVLGVDGKSVKAVVIPASGNDGRVTVFVDGEQGFDGTGNTTNLENSILESLVIPDPETKVQKVFQKLGIQI